MTFSKFEKYAAGKINDYASNVDAEGLWNDILPHVQKDDNRKRGLIWFFFVGLIAALVAFYTMTDGNHSDSVSENTAFSSANGISTNTNELSIQPADNQSVVALGVEKEVKGNLNTTDEQIVEKAIVTKKSNSPNSANNLNKNNKATDQNLETPIVPVSPNETETLTNSEPAISITDETKLNEEINETTNQKEAIPTEEPQTETELQIIDTTSIIAVEEMAVEAENSEDDEDKLPRSRFKLKYGVGLYGGFSSSFASLKNKSTLNEDYLQLRLQTEEQLETIQMGVDFMVKSEIGVYARTGIQYSRIARKFSLNSQIVTTDSVEGIQKIYINPNTGDSTFIFGQVPVTTTTTYNKTTYNYFHLMDIPIVVGYNYSNDYSNWSFGAEAGALINLSMKTKGEIMAVNGTDIYDLKEDPNKWYKDNLGVSFIASIMIAYDLNENFQIYLSPTARLESIFSTEANPIEQKHGSLGVNIGARYFIGY